MKKLAAALVLVLTAAMALTGCAGGSASNEYIEIKQYKGLEIDKVDTSAVTDKDVDKYIESQLAGQSSQKPETTVPKRKIKKGDLILLDCSAKDSKGKVVEGTELNDYQLEIGSGAFIPGWEDACIGKPFGKNFTFKLKFPDDYGTEKIAGKTVTWTVKAKGLVKQQKAAKLTDKMVKTLSEKSKTVEEYKKEVKDLLTEQKEKAAQDTLQTEIWDAVMEQTEVKKYPEDELNDIIGQYKESYENMAAQYNMTYEQLLQQMGTDDETITQQIKEQAQEQLKRQMITELLMDELKIKISDKDYEAKYAEFGELYGLGDADAFLNAAGEDRAKEMVQESYVADWMIEHAKQVEPKEDEDADSGDSGSEAADPKDKAAGDSQK